ncbi:MAG: YceH family protein [Halofilum sp. (in: g-proteobacteria)]|nr:YceH family protein [Halofilum sp. (in: g-proteobacteria)]
MVVGGPAIHVAFVSSLHTLADRRAGCRLMRKTTGVKLMDRDLTAVEIRVLGCLLEKEATTPDQYPLSINGLVTAANQKSNRVPVMALPEADVREAVTALTRRSLVRQSSSGGRVSRFEHRLGRGPGSALQAPPAQLAVLALLFLRGPQTPGELRSRAQRMAAFDDIDAVESTLQTLAAHADGALVECLPREPGKRESRWMHCLGEADSAPAPAATAPDPAPESAPRSAPGPEPSRVADDLEQRVARLERIVADLSARLGDDDTDV